MRRRKKTRKHEMRRNLEVQNETSNDNVRGRERNTSISS
jgi:hypothetical protein